MIDPFDITRDPTMPAESLMPEAMCHELARLPRLADQYRQIHLGAIRVLRHKPGRRCLIAYDLEVEHWCAASERLTLLGKVRAKGLDRTSYELLGTLWQHGFDAASADGISVPEPVGMIPAFKMWLQHKVKGVMVTEALARPRATALARRVAEAAHKLHCTRVSCARRHTIDDELNILHERLASVAAEEPQWDKRIQDILAACDQLGNAVPTTSAVGIHRDFYADQIVIDGQRMSLLDLDLYCVGDPALDIGNFCGHLIEQGVRVFGDPDALGGQQAVLENRFVELAPQVSLQAIRSYTTLTLARHIAISHAIAERRPFTEALVELCERRLQLPHDKV